MNSNIITALIENPSVLFSTFFIQPLPSVAFSYAIVWFVMRPKADRNITFPIASIHWYGIATSLVVSAIFRLIAVATFAGKNAYQPNPDTGAAAFYMFFVPAIIAAVYINSIKNKTFPKDAKLKSAYEKRYKY